MSISYLSFVKMPSKVTKSIEKLLRDFLWEGPNLEGGVYHANYKKTNHLNPWEV